MSIFKEIFAWWTGNTIGTRFTMWKAHAQFVGSDELGNRYFRAKEHYKGQGERRWVIYKGDAEATRVPPLWHGWLHHTLEHPPTDKERQGYEWQAQHTPNMTGTAYAYRPSGSLQAEGKRPAATGDYEAWTPQ